MKPSYKNGIVNSENLTGNGVNVGVIGAGNCVGTTEIAASLSIWLAERYFLSFGNPQISFFEAAFSESANGRFFKRYTLGRFLDRYAFKDIFTHLLAKDDEIIPHNSEISRWDFSKSNSWSGVNWLVPGENLPTLLRSAKSDFSFRSYSDILSRIYKSIESMEKSPVTIYDLGRGLGKEDFLIQMDLVIGVASPKNSLLQNALNDIHSIEFYRKNNGNMIWAVNQSSDGMDKKYIRQVLGGGHIIYLSKFDDDRVLKCDSESKFLFEDDFIKTSLWKSFDRIASFFEKVI